MREFYFGVSALFLQKDAPDLAWLWIRDRKANISGATYDWSSQDKPHRFHRLLLIQRLEETENIFVRELLQYVVRTLCHLHLWDGSVLYVVFLSKKDVNIKKLGIEMNCSYFSSGVMFPLTGFWEPSYSASPRVSGDDAKQQMHDVLSLLPRTALSKAITLWYDKKTYERRRRPNDALYRAQRRFIYELCAGYCQAPRGSKRCLNYATPEEGHLDHIIPISMANNVLLNLTWLCGPCNGSKGMLRTNALPLERARAAMPRDLATMELRDGVSLTPPAWLKRYRLAPKPVLAKLLVKPRPSRP